jgi:DNA replication and repair protein RecF
LKIGSKEPKNRPKLFIGIGSGVYIESLYIHRFRNYEKAFFSFTPGINLITGNNAQGKTNLLEAIYFLSMGRSFRTRYLSELIQQKQAGFFLEVCFFKEGIKQVIKASFDGETRKMTHNDNVYEHFVNLLGLLPTVLFAPSDTSLIMGAPGDRRRFLDLHIAQIDPLYVHHLSRYVKAMKQRNVLLRQKSEEGIAAWEESMALSASYVMAKRSQAILELSDPIQQEMAELTEGLDLLSAMYKPSAHLGTASELVEQFKRHRKRELHIGNTLIGPHLDEVSLLINGQEAKTFSSEGQKRSAIAALRFAEWRRLKNTTHSTPLMSIDDFGVHLDHHRQQLLETKLSSLGQVFLTSPEQERSLMTSAHRLKIASGKLLLS